MTKKNGNNKEIEEVNRGPTDETEETNPSVGRDVYEENGCYYKLTNSRRPQPRLISNFILRAKSKVVFESHWFYMCEAIRNTGQKYEICLYKDNFLSASAFNLALSSHSDLEFYGTNDDTTQIKGILVDQEPLIVKGTAKNGMHLIGSRLVYVEGNNIIDKDGQVSDLVYIGGRNHVPKLSGLCQQANISEKDLRAIFENLNKFNHPSITYPVLGFIGYCFAKEAISQKVEHRNPFLLLQGEPGTGKSLTISRIIMPIFDSRQLLTNISSVTEYVLAVNSNKSNMTPVCYDEFKHVVLTRSQKRIVERLLLATYAQTGLQRGRPDKVIDNLQMTSPIVLAGEMTIDSTSLDHRKIEVFFSYGKRKGTSDSFQHLIHQSLEKFGKGLLQHTLELGASRLAQAYDEQESLVDINIDDRFRDNAALMRTGLWLIIDYLRSHDINADSYEEGYGIIDAGIMDVVNRARITNVEKTIADFCIMADMGILVSNNDYEIKGNDLCLKIASVYAKYARWSRRNGTSEFIGKTSFLQQLAEKEYFNGKNTMRIGGQPCNAISIDLSGLPEGIDINWPGHQRIGLSKAVV